jgi:hypothetical protein
LPRFLDDPAAAKLLRATRAGASLPAITMVYARIADRTVANEYFAVSEKVEALYDQPRALAADSEGSEMSKLRREMDPRMLGNSYCARPVEMDCHFESICESCSFFATTKEAAARSVERLPTVLEGHCHAIVSHGILKRAGCDSRTTCRGNPGAAGSDAL